MSERQTTAGHSLEQSLEAISNLMRGIRITESCLSFFTNRTGNFAALSLKSDGLRAFIGLVSDSRVSINQALSLVTGPRTDTYFVAHQSAFKAENVAQAYREVQEGLAVIRESVTALMACGKEFSATTLLEDHGTPQQIGSRLVTIKEKLASVLQEIVDTRLIDSSTVAMAISETIRWDSEVAEDKKNWRPAKKRDLKKAAKTATAPSIELTAEALAKKPKFDDFIEDHSDQIIDEADDEDHPRLVIAFELAVGSDDGQWVSKQELKHVCGIHNGNVLGGQMKVLRQKLHAMGISIETDRERYQLKWIK